MNNDFNEGFLEKIKKFINDNLHDIIFIKLRTNLGIHNTWRLENSHPDLEFVKEERFYHGEIREYYWILDKLLTREIALPIFTILENIKDSKLSIMEIHQEEILNHLDL